MQGKQKSTVKSIKNMEEDKENSIASTIHSYFDKIEISSIPEKVLIAHF